MSEQSCPNPNSVHLTVTSVARSIKFYREKLGFALAEVHPDPKKPVWASLRLGSQAVMVGSLPSLEEARRYGMDKAEIELLKKDAKAFARGAPGVGVALYLHVEDVDAYHKKIRRKRLKPLTRLKTQFYGIRDFTVEDPDGYRLVFYSPATAACPA